MNLIIKQFIKFCEKKEIQLLSEDIAYISKWISKIPMTESKGVLSGYYREWCEGMDLEDKMVKKQGVGRRLANKWMEKECLSILLGLSR